MGALAVVLVLLLFYYRTPAKGSPQLLYDQAANPTFEAPVDVPSAKKRNSNRTVPNLTYATPSATDAGQGYLDIDSGTKTSGTSAPPSYGELINAQPAVNDEDSDCDL